MEFPVVFGTKVKPDNDTGTDGKAIEEKDQHVDDDRGGADGGQCLFSDIIADDDGIDGVVQHLEDVAQHERQGKEDDLLQNRAAGHAAGGCFSRFVVHKKSLRIRDFTGL